MRILIADDEPLARQVLAELLEEIRGVTVAGEAANGREAVEKSLALKPDLLLLDLHMPGLDGLAVARALRGSPLPLVIYVTAFDQHALAAFDSGAVDYLLKPVRKERLEAAVEKARRHLAGLAPPKEELRRIVGRIGADLHLLDPGDVIAFKAEGDTVLILTQQGRYYSDHSLRQLEEKLPVSRFRRIHRGTIINADHIRKISPLTSKRFLLQLTGGFEAVVSKRMAGVIREATKW
jgi:DNA-binding LytR/AlgR family response regulator